MALPYAQNVELPYPSRFPEDECANAYHVLSHWQGKHKLNSRHKRRIRWLIKSYNLQCVPTWGAAAICDVAPPTFDAYVNKGLVRVVNILFKTQFFGRYEVELRWRAVQDLRDRLDMSVSESIRSIGRQAPARSISVPTQFFHIAAIDPPDDTYRRGPITRNALRQMAKERARFWYDMIPVVGLHRDESDVGRRALARQEALYVSLLEQQYEVVD